MSGDGKDSKSLDSIDTGRWDVLAEHVSMQQIVKNRLNFIR